MKPQAAKVLRNSELAIIHIARQQLALEEDEYRDILQSITGKASAAELDWKGRKLLLDHFKNLGFKVVAKKAGRAKPSVGQDRKALMDKIEAQLAEAGRSWAYADSLAKRICKVDSISFCRDDHLLKIVAALSYDARRHGRDEG